LKSFRRRRGIDLERELRTNRPEPRPELVAMISEKIDRAPRRQGVRIAFGAALTAAMLAAVAAVGGVGFAASSVQKVAKSVIRITHTSQPRTINKSSAADQYRKVRVCHKGKVIEISENALPAHLKHGDYVTTAPKGSKCALRARTSKPKHGGKPRHGHAYRAVAFGS
jgi:hypothetical protein